MASDAESSVLKAMIRKERQATEMFQGIIAEMHDFQVGKKQQEIPLQKTSVPAWLR